MSVPTMAEVERLSIAERIQLVEDIWDTIAADPEKVPVTEAQRREIDRRLEAYRRNPGGGSSWEEVKARITGRRQP